MFYQFKRPNYFDDPTKLFSNLYLIKFLDISAKSFFSNTSPSSIYNKII